MKMMQLHKPEVVTKDIKIGATPAGGRRIRLSSNFLELMGFGAGERTNIELLSELKGFRVVRGSGGTTKIYQRSYSRRVNNPLESQIDIQNQSIINRAIPAYAERVHIQIDSDAVLVRPLPNETFQIRRRISMAERPYDSFVAMTAGIDVAAMVSAGFSIHSVLEYRPQEARDRTDLTETGALNVLANGAPRLLFNQDITRVDWASVSNLVEHHGHISFAHISLGCDDYSFVKSKSLKERSLTPTKLDTTIDLVYDSLRLIETLRPAVVMIENTAPFAGSAASDLLSVRLSRWGYQIHARVMDPRDFGGLTSRKRYYLVASVWPGFRFPTGDFWMDLSGGGRLQDLVKKHIRDCRDVSHTLSLQKGLALGRARIIKPESNSAPTILKSQNRQAKDSVYIQFDGRYFLPSEGLLRDLHGFPESVNLESVSPTLASEVIGQSVDFSLHHSILVEIHRHISANITSPIFRSSL